jgi:hypothetical protein
LASKILSDPTHSLGTHLRTRSILDITVSPPITQLPANLKEEYTHGMNQPGILFVASNGKVLYKDEIRPAEENRNGANNRPEPKLVWEFVQKEVERWKKDPSGYKSPEAWPEIPRITELDRSML